MQRACSELVIPNCEWSLGHHFMELMLCLQESTGALGEGSLDMFGARPQITRYYCKVTQHAVAL